MRLEDLQAQRTPCGMLLVLAGLREILALAGMNYYTSIVSLLVPVNKGFHIVRVRKLSWMEVLQSVMLWMLVC